MYSQIQLSIVLKKSGFYFNKEQCDGDVCLENYDDDDGSMIGKM
jgi:hypothetical protein